MIVKIVKATLPRIVALLIMMILFANAGFSIPQKERITRPGTLQIDNPHKQDNGTTNSDSNKLLSETELEETSEILKKHSGFEVSPIALFDFSHCILFSQSDNEHRHFSCAVFPVSKHYLKFRSLLI